MGKAEITKELILKEAFKLFIKNNYEKVTILDIENASRQAKGTIFYHFKNKEHIFKSVIDRFIIEAQNLKNKMKIKDESRSLHQFIRDYVDGVNNTMSRLKLLLNLEPDENITKYYINLIMQASVYYENFNEKVNDIREHELIAWFDNISKARQAGEIKEETDPLWAAKNFHYVFYGLVFNYSILKEFEALELYEIYLSIYNIIKKK